MVRVALHRRLHGEDSALRTARAANSRLHGFEDPGELWRGEGIAILGGNFGEDFAQRQGPERAIALRDGV